MRNITTIELQKITHGRLKVIGGMCESFNDVINRLIKDHDELEKYIQEYIERADGKCINEIILGRRVIANHHFCTEDGKCNKCQLHGPVTIRQGDIVIDNEIGHM